MSERIAIHCNVMGDLASGLERTASSLASFLHICKICHSDHVEH